LPLTLLTVIDWEWAYFIDFENRELETWDGNISHIVTFEDLVKGGVERYLALINERKRKRALNLKKFEGK
jgi:hypothetical protein